jgi:hypothetical protein
MFYKARTIGYGIAQKLGRYSGLTGDTSISGTRRATYGTAKFLGDASAAGGGNIGRRAVSRMGGNILRYGRINTGIPQLDSAYARYVSEQVGKVSMAAQGDLYRNPSSAKQKLDKSEVQWFFTIDTSQIQQTFSSPYSTAAGDEASNLAAVATGGSVGGNEGYSFVSDKIQEATQDILSYIQSNAPVKTGEYRNSFYIMYVDTEIGPVGVVKTEDPKFIHLEYGTRKMAPRRVIRASVERSEFVQPAPELRSFAYGLDV